MRLCFHVYRRFSACEALSGDDGKHFNQASSLVGSINFDVRPPIPVLAMSKPILPTFPVSEYCILFQHVFPTSRWERSNESGRRCCCDGQSLGYFCGSKNRNSYLAREANGLGVIEVPRIENQNCTHFWHFCSDWTILLALVILILMAQSLHPASTSLSSFS